MNLLLFADVMYSFRESNFAGKIITLVLFFSSIYVWTLMVTKFTELRKAESNARRFLRVFRGEAEPLALFLRRQNYGENPLSVLYQKGCMEVADAEDQQGGGGEGLFAGALVRSGFSVSRKQLERMRTTVDRNVPDQILILERRMNILAIAVTTCPFLGLLGTVWGVMDSFGSMAVVGSANLSAVAPGIAGALLTTVIGLLVAIPSAVAYNLLLARIRELHVLTDGFAQELVADVERHYVQER